MAINSELLIERLALVDENILAEAARQPILFIDAVRFRVAAMRRRSQAVAELGAKRSRIALVIRAKGVAAGERVTDKNCAERVDKHSLIRELSDKVDRAIEVEEFSKLILEAYRMRRDAIRVIAESQIAEGMRATKEIEHIEQRGKMHRTVRDLEIRRNRVKSDE